MNTVDILVVGVGGQGVITASEILSEVGILAGYDVKKSEIHGMSQRGGSVSSDVRFNKEKVYSPTIRKGHADFILGFEILESFRALPFAKESGVVITSDYKLDPMTVSAGTAKYPEDLQDKIKALIPNSYFFNNDATIELVKNPRALNVFILGALASFLPIEIEIWKKVIERKVPQRTIEINLAAFDEGYKIGKK